MHEIPNLPFPSLHQPQQPAPTQSASHKPDGHDESKDKPRAQREG
jgi:hypothetical protein